MNIVSCPGCGTLFDANILSFPLEIENSDGTIDKTKAIWLDKDFRPKVDCPHCGSPIVQDYD